MEYTFATEEDLRVINHVIQTTIQTVYPLYYKEEVVDFFREQQQDDTLLQDITLQHVFLVKDRELIVGVGSFCENKITRLYILPQYQKRGFGRYLLLKLEDCIGKEYSTITIEASLPSTQMLHDKGYKTKSHGVWYCENDSILVYEILEKILYPGDTIVSYDGKRFIPQFRSQNREIGENTVFTYHQNGRIFWADYAGGEVIRGSLTGTVSRNGDLDFVYQHINKNYDLRMGKGHSVPEITHDGRIELHETWQYLGNDEATQESITIEK